MAQRLIVAGIYGVALVISAVLLRETWRTMGPNVEVIVRGAFGAEQRLSRVWGLIPFGGILVVGALFGHQMVKTGVAFPDPLFAMFWLGICLAMQLFLLVAGKERRARVDKQRKEIFGE